MAGSEEEEDEEAGEGEGGSDEGPSPTGWLCAAAWSTEGWVRREQKATAGLCIGGVARVAPSHRFVSQRAAAREEVTGRPDCLHRCAGAEGGPSWQEFKLIKYAALKAKQHQQSAKEALERVPEEVLSGDSHFDLASFMRSVTER